MSICCLQETEIPVDFPEIVLNSGGFNLELENNDEKKRVGIYLLNGITYTRRNDLELKNMHVVVIDVVCERKIRIINVYRSFRPPGNQSPETFFIKQLELIFIIKHVKDQINTLNLNLNEYRMGCKSQEKIPCLTFIEDK